MLHALPLAWNLVKSMTTTGTSSALRDAVADFLNELFQLMGDSLFDHAASAPSSSPQFVQRVKEITNSGQ